jgi:hypothetical protein
MSYCRFNNTSNDIEDCLKTLDNSAYISKAEKSSGVHMFKTFLNFCMKNDIIEDYDSEAVEFLFENCSDNEEDDFDE